MDGVMVDTGEFHLQAWNKVLVDYAIPFSKEIFRTTFGMNNTGLLAKISDGQLAPEQVAEISSRKESQFRQDVHGKVQLLPGVRAWLQLAHDLGYAQAVASSAPQANIDLLLDELDVCHFFQAHLFFVIRVCRICDSSTCLRKLRWYSLPSSENGR